MSSDSIAHLSVFCKRIRSAIKNQDNTQETGLLEKLRSNRFYTDFTTQKRLLIKHFYEKKFSPNKGTRDVPFSQSYLGWLFGVDSHNVGVTQSLYELQKDFPYVRITMHSVAEKRCTTVNLDDIERIKVELYDAFADAFGEWQEEQRVYLATEKPFSRKQRKAHCRTSIDLAKEYQWRYHGQKTIADYAHSISLHYFLHCAEQHLPVAYEAALHSSDPLAEKAKLQAFAERPFPILHPSQREGSLTARVFPDRGTNSTKIVRDQLFPGLVECDLSSAYTTIFASLYENQKILDIIGQGNIWSHLIDAIGVASTESVKKAIKQATHATTFGMSQHHIREMLAETLPEGANISQFLKHPLIHELLRTRKRALAAIEEKQGMQTAYGWLEKPSWAEPMNVLSAAISTYELSIISAAYELAARDKETHNQDFTIVLYQYDGFALIPTPSADLNTIQQRIQRSMVERAHTFNIPIHILWQNNTYTPQYCLKKK